MAKHTGTSCLGQASADQAEVLSQLCYVFVRPVLCRLHQVLDRRLVKTVLDLLQVIVMHRHRPQGLVLSELGGYLLGPGQAPAGTKRIDRLLKSPRWQAATLIDYLWEKGDEAVNRLQPAPEALYGIWDESVLEKPESLKAERLGPVRSTKAARLKRIKPGYYNPPGGRPIFVPGMNWLMVLVAGPKGAPTLASLRWWTTRGEQAERKRWVEREILSQAWQRWGRQVLHIWDRGCAWPSTVHDPGGYCCWLCWLVGRCFPQAGQLIRILPRMQRSSSRWSFCLRWYACARDLLRVRSLPRWRQARSFRA